MIFIYRGSSARNVPSISFRGKGIKHGWHSSDRVRLNNHRFNSAYVNGNHVAAGTATDDALSRGIELVRKRGAIVLNKYAHDRGVLAEWTSASHTETRAETSERGGTAAERKVIRGQRGISMQMRATSIQNICLVLLLLSSLNSVAVAARNTKRPISDEEFLWHFKHNEPISERIVPESAVIGALRWAQDAEALKESLPADGLRVLDCEVADFTLVDIKEDDEGNETRSYLLKETAVAELPAELSKEFEAAGVERIMVVPVEIYFEGSQLGRFGHECSFDNVVFMRAASFDSCTFPGIVSFENTVFQDDTQFEFCEFEANESVSFKEATFHQIEFAETKFPCFADFEGAKFRSYAHFSNTFDNDVSFKNINVDDDLDFESTSFHKQTNFAGANIGGSVHFNACNFEGDLFFIDAKGGTPESLKGSVEFDAVPFAGRSYFTNVRLDKLLFFPPAISDDETKTTPKGHLSRDTVSPVSFNQRAVFTRLECNHADFKEVEFRDYADFTSARFRQSVDISNVSYEGGVSFYNTEFPSFDQTATTADVTGGVILDGVRFQKGVVLNWSQIDGKVNTKDPQTFKLIEDTFSQSRDLPGQNAAMYQRRRIEVDNAKWSRVLNFVDCWFWGYGVRPLRLIGWICILFVGFTATYYLQPEALKSRGGKIKNKWTRLRFVTKFSLRTSWTLGFGYKSARTSTFKAIALVQSIGFKVLFVLLLQAFANTSPLLNELVGKFVRV